MYNSQCILFLEKLNLREFMMYKKNFVKKIILDITINIFIHNSRWNYEFQDGIMNFIIGL